MKLIYRSLTVAAAFVLTMATVGMAQTNFVIALNGAQEVPANASPAIGSGTAVLNAAQTQLTVNYSFAGLVAPQSNQHIHNAVPGIAGPVKKNLPTGSPVINFVWSTSDGTQPLTAASVVELLAERMYVNIHSTTFPGGEIRGQLLLEQVATEGTSWSRIKNLLN